MLCNVQCFRTGFATSCRNFLRKAAACWIFGGDNFSRKLQSRLPQILPASYAKRSSVRRRSGEKIGKFDIDHPALQNLSEDTLQESIKSARVGVYAAPLRRARPRDLVGHMATRC